MGGDPGRRRSRSRPPRDAIRGARERKIRGIIAERPVGTQEEMAAALRRQGLAVTQATVSRDIKRLGLVKAPSPPMAALVMVTGSRMPTWQDSHRSTRSTSFT